VRQDVFVAARDGEDVRRAQYQPVRVLLWGGRFQNNPRLKTAKPWIWWFAWASYLYVCTWPHALEEDNAN
jgi:hypothetical protein